MTVRVSMLLKLRASPDMLLLASVTRKTFNSAHEQTHLSNDTIACVLWRRELGRDKDLSALPRIRAKCLQVSIQRVQKSWKFLNGIFPIDLLLSCPLGQKCCPDGERYDLGPPWTTFTRPVPPPRCLEYPVKYLLSNRYN
jgi:hypothetical protein